MKKILFTLAAAAMVLGAASCQKENLGKIETVKTVDNPLNTILVKVASDTKLAVDSENLKPAFEENDVIFGWDAEGTAYAYTCTEVTEDAATFTRTSSGAPSADEGTKVNLVYAPGCKIEDIVDKTLDVNLAIQGETLPVVMHCGAEVDAQGICQAVFSNDVAIVDIKDAVLPGAAEGDEYTVAFHGKNTSLKFNLNESGVINYQADVEGPISSSIKAKASADSKISKRFAVPASLEATDVKITATAADGSTYTFSAGNKEIVAGKYITVTGKEFAPQYVAKISETQYTSMAKAIAAANEATEDVTIEMLNDANVDSQISFSNTNNNSITLDLNGRTISSTVDFAITASTELIVTDNSGTGSGKITSSGNAPIYLNGDNQGKVTIKKCTVEYTGTDADHTVLRIDGTSDKTAASITVDENAKIVSNSRCCYAKYGKFDFKTCELTSGKTKDSPAVFNSTGGKIDIYDGCSVLGLAESKPILCSGTSNSSAGSYIKVNGGWFTGNNNNAIMAGTTGTASYIAFITLDGGKYSTNKITNVEGVLPVFGDGKNIFPCDPVESHSHAGVQYTYNYEVVEGVVNVAKVSVSGKEDQAFGTANKALSYALEQTAPSTITLLGDCSLAEQVDISVAKNITMNLNGYTFTVASPRIKLDNSDAMFTITDNSPSEKGVYFESRTDGYYGFTIAAGTLILEKGTFKSTAASGPVYLNQTSGKTAKFVMNGGMIDAQAATGIVAKAGTAEINAGKVYSKTSYAMSQAGSTVTINGGTFIAEASHTLYLSNAKSTLNINGGAFVAKTDGKYPIYSNDSKDNKYGHVTTITNSTSEPLFVGGGNSGTSDGRALYNGGGTSTISASAGYFTKPNLGLTSAADKYVATGYKRSTGLDVKKTIDGKEYTFVMQVVAE